MIIMLEQTQGTPGTEAVLKVGRNNEHGNYK